MYIYIDTTRWAQLSKYLNNMSCSYSIHKRYGLGNLTCPARVSSRSGNKKWQWNGAGHVEQSHRGFHVGDIYHGDFSHEFSDDEKPEHFNISHEKLKLLSQSMSPSPSGHFGHFLEGCP